jgi:hypothetical protein
MIQMPVFINTSTDNTILLPSMPSVRTTEMLGHLRTGRAGSSLPAAGCQTMRLFHHDGTHEVTRPTFRATGLDVLMSIKLSHPSNSKTGRV